VLHSVLTWFPDAGVRLDGDGINTGIGGFWASFFCTVLGFFLLVPLYAIRALGAGDVKMQMGFGAWVGAFFGWDRGWLVLLVAFCIGGSVGGVFWPGVLGLQPRRPEDPADMPLFPVCSFGHRGL